MLLTTDGGGRFILLAGEEGTYEEFAWGPEAFASVRSYLPEQATPGVFHVGFTYSGGGGWPAGAESRVLVRTAPMVYGRERRIRDLKFDLVEQVGPTLSMTSTVEAYLRVRAITTEFDPETATWEWAYDEGNLELSVESAGYLLGNASGGVGGALPAKEELAFARVERAGRDSRLGSEGGAGGRGARVDAGAVAGESGERGWAGGVRCAGVTDQLALGIGHLAFWH